MTKPKVTGTTNSGIKEANRC